jgi:2-aminoethylphosphonate-pyruvate transaminase
MRGVSSESCRPSDVTAVILAAGMGQRLRGVHAEPKGLLRLGGETLVGWTLRALERAGVRDVVLVTGYRAESYRAWLAAEAPHVRVRHNAEFARTGSMHSLWLAREDVPGDLLLIESDLRFEDRALPLLLAAPRGDWVLASGATGQGDEVLAYGTAGRLAALTKLRRSGEAELGEFVGISRLTRDGFAALCRHYESEVIFPSNFHYDDGLTALAARREIRVLVEPGLQWAEIDTAEQHARAGRLFGAAPVAERTHAT